MEFSEATTDMMHARMLGKYGELQARSARPPAGKESNSLEYHHGSPPRYRVRFVSASHRSTNRNRPPGTTFKDVTPPSRNRIQVQ
jgi:hypothetical protein